MIDGLEDKNVAFGVIIITFQKLLKKLNKTFEWQPICCVLLCNSMGIDWEQLQAAIHHPKQNKTGMVRIREIIIILNACYPLTIPRMLL